MPATARSGLLKETSIIVSMPLYYFGPFPFSLQPLCSVSSYASAGDEVEGVCFVEGRIKRRRVAVWAPLQTMTTQRRPSRDDGFSRRGKWSSSGTTTSKNSKK